VLPSSALYMVASFPLEDLSDASFLGKLLVLPANVRLDLKVIARYKYSSLFDLVVCNEERKFYNIGPRCQSYKTFSLRSLWVD
jgi:hypothetical protein